MNVLAPKNRSPSDGSQKTKWQLSRKRSYDFDYLSVIYGNHLPE
jgi:hypothetical protein